MVNMKLSSDLKRASTRADDVIKLRLAKIEKENNAKSAARLASLWLAKTRVKQLEETISQLRQRAEKSIDALVARESLWQQQLRMSDSKEKQIQSKIDDLNKAMATLKSNKEDIESKLASALIALEVESTEVLRGREMTDVLRGKVKELEARVRRDEEVYKEAQVRYEQSLTDEIAKGESRLIEAVNQAEQRIINEMNIEIVKIKDNHANEVNELKEQVIQTRDQALADRNALGSEQVSTLCHVCWSFNDCMFPACN